MSKYRLVNWTGTMEISDSQFRQTENFFLATIAEAVKLGLTNYNYGLLPAGSRKSAYNGIRVNEHITGNIEVQLYGCKAVTASGFPIDFDADDTGNPLIKNYSPSEDKNIRNRDVRQWDIILAVDPFSRRPVGEPDPEEIPPRHPDTDSTYGLYVMPAGEINTKEFGRHHLTIGRIRKDGERYTVDTQYIPPCASMSSHPELQEYYNIFASRFSSIEKSSKTIIEKIHERSNKSDLALNVRAMCHDILRYIAGIYFDFRNKGRMAPPIDIVKYISGTAYTFYASLMMVNTRQKEEMLKYFYEWTDISPGSFEELISSTLDIIYEHDNIRSMMVRTDHFLHTITELWERLARLEFIGQHKESIVVSAHDHENKSSGQGSGGWIVRD